MGSPEDHLLLIVDDDDGLREQIASYLRGYGFRVLEAPEGRTMDRLLRENAVDLIVLDLMMPGEDGLSICRRLDMPSGPAIIMCSAAGDETDRVIGLELGADDYMQKPFSPRELLARIRALLRRREDARRGGLGMSDLYRFKGFEYEPTRRTLRSPEGATILLTAGEAALLGTLLATPQRIVTREKIAFLDEGESPGRSVDLHVSRLRKKLEGHGGEGLIRTQRGMGYMIDAAVSRA